MQMDPEYLREHYASLSDEALRAIDRASLIEVAQRCYDEEIRQRSPVPVHLPDEDDEPVVESLDEGDRAAWLEEAAEVWSWSDLPGTSAGVDAEIARKALENAGIPCYLDLVADDPDATNRWRLRVPGKLNLRATSVLERDIQNADFVADWKTHLETLSDQELREMNPQVTFCGLIDRIERVTRAYDEELTRRKLKR